MFFRYEFGELLTVKKNVGCSMENSFVKNYFFMCRYKYNVIDDKQKMKPTTLATKINKYLAYFTALEMEQNTSGDFKNLVDVYWENGLDCDAGSVAIQRYTVTKMFAYMEEHKDWKTKRSPPEELIPDVFKVFYDVSYVSKFSTFQYKIHCFSSFPNKVRIYSYFSWKIHKF